jgi:molybdopterin synthase catalytic subunit
MKIEITKEAFDPWYEIQQYQSFSGLKQSEYGATSVFVGTMRDFNVGSNVKAMELEHYPGMTEKKLAEVVNETLLKWNLIDVLVIHRVGIVLPNDPIVLVAVWSSHRGDAFDGSRYIMESLKSKVPFWKKEVLVSDAERWVEKNTDGYLHANSD